jgi:glycosyltransferase involved in cell wall biosynthesis
MNVSLVIPCYNEEDALPETARRIEQLVRDLIERGKIDANSSVWLVDDGSRDRTWEIIEGLARKSKLFVGLKLSRNRGHQNALLAGLLTADGDAVISLDADLQDDLGAIERMIDAHAEGYEIVYGVRQSRTEDTWFKRRSALLYYDICRVLGVSLVPNHADYRLMGRRAIAALGSYEEVNLFLRGIIPQLGYRSTSVFYDRGARVAGESKYPLRKMVALALNGVTSFSALPMRLIGALGFIVFVASMLMTLWALGTRLFTDNAIPGWASTALPVYALGGIQLLCMGVLGEYIAKIYLETKRRPRFFIERIERGRPPRTPAGEHALRESPDRAARL